MAKETLSFNASQESIPQHEHVIFYGPEAQKPKSNVSNQSAPIEEHEIPIAIIQVHEISISGKSLGSDIEAEDNFDVEHYQQDLVLAKEQGPQSLTSYLETLKADRERFKERYQVIKEEAHEKSRQWHEKLQTLKELQEQAEEQLRLANEADERHKREAAEPQGFLDRLIHKLSDN